MCLFAFTAMNAQINSVAIVGAGIEPNGWPGQSANPGPIDKYQLTRVGTTDVWTYTGLVMAGGSIKFRANNSWDAAPNGGNWGAPLTGSAFPIGIGAENSGGSKDIPAVAGTYDITFNVVTGDYSFTGGPPIAVVKIFGTATTPPSGILMSTADGIVYTAPANTTLLAGNAQFDVDGTVVGAKAWPSGTATGVVTDFIPVTAGKYTSITFNKDSGDYSFVAAPVFDEIGLIGSGTTGTDGGWGADIAKMTTTDGITYNLKNIQLYSVNTSDGSPAKVKFRTYGAWTQDWGGTAFPTGPTVGNNSDIVVTTAGTYAITFNRTTGAYNFGTALAVNKFDKVSLNAYPNPTKTSWNITSNDDITSVQVYDMLGKSVYAKTTTSKELSINAAELSKGMYFAKVSTANGTSTVKLVKE